MKTDEIRVQALSDEEVAARLAGEFFIRGVEILARCYGGDLIRGIVFTAIAVANREASPTASPDAPPRPVSVMAISSSIGLPYETTRRYVNILVAGGDCERIGRSGVVATQQALSRPEMLAAYKETYASFNRLVGALKRNRYPGLGA